MHVRLDIEPARPRIPPSIIRAVKNQHVTRLDVVVAARDPVFGRGVAVSEGGVRQTGDGIVGVGGAVVGALSGRLRRDVGGQSGVADAGLAVVVLFFPPRHKASVRGLGRGKEKGDRSRVGDECKG